MKTEKSEHPDLWEYLATSLEKRRADDLLRTPRVCTPVSETIVEFDGQQLINFGANDYLGLTWRNRTTEPGQPSVAIQASSIQGALTNKIGSGASPAVTGLTPAHQELIDTIAQFEQTESAIVFSSGYAANVGTVAALATDGDLILSDQLNHASLIDGCRLSRATTRIYEHLNLHTLEHILTEERSSYRNAFIVTDSVFSMDGDLAPLTELVTLCEKYNAYVILDEAHATGVLGSRGRGLTEHCGIASSRVIKIGTLSKAIGCVGGFVAGPKVLCHWLANFARSWVYSTASTLPNMRDATEAIRMVETMALERERLQRSSVELREKLLRAGISTLVGITPIIPVYCGSPEQTLKMSVALRNMGFYVPAIRPPTVPEGKSMLRISLSSQHTEPMLTSLANAIIGLQNS